MMNKTYVKLLLIAVLFPIHTGIRAVNLQQDDPTGNPADSVAQSARTKEFQKIVAGSVVDDGMFTIYKTRAGNYYFEIPDSLLQRDMLFGSRVSAISDNSKISAGQRRSNPILISFSVKDKTLLMHRPTGSSIAASTDPVSVALDRNNVVPVAMTFDIAARNKTNDASLVDVTKLFAAEVDMVFPAGAGNTGRPDSKSSYIAGMKSYPENIEIKSVYNYSGGREPFNLTVNYSLILLSREPMRPRLNDDRIGYSGENKRIYESGKPHLSAQFIDRWRIEAAPEDVEKHRRGEKVTPSKPIIFYLDTIMPEKWRKYVKTGIEDWNAAFEKIGFVNTILAVDFPRDKDFDPDDSRFNCFRYIASTDANAQGPQWIDPRSGEIVQGDILWWHNVIDLLQTWRFVQTAAADPDAREKVLNDAILGEAIRYAVAHEMGHVLGFQHNMRGSYAYPTDSLRSATFTQQYGTTASIMDYARNNYIAQPGDKEKGVRLTPPVLGPYDFHAVQYGYKPIYEAKNPQDELPVLDRWFTEKGNDPKYLFGPTTVSVVIPDPSAQSDALGDDLLKSADYGISNLKFITENLVNWTLNPDDKDELLNKRFEAILKLHGRLTVLPLSYLGGVYTIQGPISKNAACNIPVEKSKQQETLRKTIANLVDYQWLNKVEINQYLGSNTDKITEWQTNILTQLLGNFIIGRITENEALYHAEAYSLAEYLADLDKEIWQATSGKTFTNFEKHIQLIYVDKLCELLNPAVNKADKQEMKSGKETTAASAAAVQLSITKERIKKLQGKNKAQAGHYQLLLQMINNNLKQ